MAVRDWLLRGLSILLLHGLSTLRRIAGGVSSATRRRDGGAAGPSFPASIRWGVARAGVSAFTAGRRACARHHGSDEIAARRRVGAGAAAATEGGDGHGHQKNDNRDSQSFFAHFPSPFSDASPVQGCGAQGMDGDRTLGGEHHSLSAQLHPFEGGNVTTIPDRRLGEAAQLAD